MGEKTLIGPDIVQETTNKIRLIIENTHNRQKSYAYKRMKHLEFQEGEHVFLRVTPKTRVGRSMKVRKLSPHFIGPLSNYEKSWTCCLPIGSSTIVVKSS